MMGGQIQKLKSTPKVNPKRNPTIRKYVQKLVDRDSYMAREVFEPSIPEVL